MTNECSDVLHWLDIHRGKTNFNIKRISFAESREWKFRPQQTAFVHKSGQFFNIEGYECRSNFALVFYQPLINQWEVGFQAILLRQINEEYQILMQAKTEPGNINVTQVSPTLQATWSNITAVHQGKVPAHSQIFLNPKGHDVLFDILQPELGTRYFKKRNRNIAINFNNLHVEQDVCFRWISLKAIRELFKLNSIINHDARLVCGYLFITCGNMDAPDDSGIGNLISDSWMAASGQQFGSAIDIIKWLKALRAQYALEVKNISLLNLPDWEITKDEIRHRSGKHFSVIQLAVHSEDREITAWDQPIINTHSQAFYGLLCQQRNGVLHILLKAFPHIGNHDGAELLPSVFADSEDDLDKDDIIFQRVKSANGQEVIFECICSDEGGRFFQDDGIQKIVLIPENEKIKIPENYCWLTLGQIKELIQHENMLSDAAVGIIALLFSCA